MLRRAALFSVVVTILGALGACSGDAEPTSRGASRPPVPRERETREGPSTLSGATPSGRALAERFADRVRFYGGPDLEVRVGDARHVFLNDQEADLANLELECAADPSGCEAAVDRWARVAASPPVEERVDRIFAALVPTADARATLATQPGVITTRPLVGPFTISLVLDTPDSILPFDAGMRARLGLSENQAFERALENMRAAFHDDLPHVPLDEAHPRVRRVVIGDSYENARVILHERWAPIAASVEGALLVTVPSRDVVLFTGAAHDDDVATLRDATRIVIQREPWPIGPGVLRYTASGWELFDANE